MVTAILGAERAAEAEPRRGRARGGDLPRARAAAAAGRRPVRCVASEHDRAADRVARRAPDRRRRDRRGRGRLPRRGDAACALARERGTRSPSRRTCTCARTRSSSTGSPTRTSASCSRRCSSRQRDRPEGGARDRLRLHARGAAAGDRARGHGALPGDPGDRQEDRRARRAGAEGEGRARRAGSRRRRRRATSRARDALVELGYSLLDAEAALAGVDPEPAGRGAGAARAEEGGVTDSTQFLAPELGARGGRARPLAPAEAARRLRRPGAHQGAARRSRSRRRARAARRSTTCCSSARPGSARRASRSSSARSSASASAPSPAPRSSGRATWRRSSPALEERDVLFVDEIHRLNRADRGDPLPGARGLPARHRRRPGPGGAHAHARPAAVHARRRDDAHGPAHDAAARPLRDDVPARLLRARGARA